MTCFATENDLHGLSVGEVQLDDADEYVLAGDELTLGAGGILAAQPDVFRHDAALKTQSYPAEFQLNSAAMQCGDEPRL